MSTSADRGSDDDPIPERSVLGRRWLHLPAAVVFAVLSIASFTILSGTIRQLESDVAGRLAGFLTGNDVRPIPGIGSMLVLRHGEPIIARVTYWCSLSTVLGSLFAGSALLAFGRRTPARRLLLAIVAAVVTVVVVNQLRLVSTAFSGRQWGGSVMTRVHDYVGTPLSMVGFGAAMFLLVTWALGRRSGRVPTTAAPS